VIGRQRIPAACHGIADWHADHVTGDAAGFTARVAHVGFHPCFAARSPIARSRPLCSSAPITGAGSTVGHHTAYGPGSAPCIGPLSDLVGDFVAADLVIDAIVELGEPTPDVLALGAHRPDGRE
jgi:hypothetical protein